MPAGRLQFMVEGPEAEAVAGEFAKRIQKHLGAGVTPVPVGTAGPEPGKRVAPDWLDTGLKVAGFLLSLPGAALTLHTLKERLKTRAKVDELKKDAEKLEKSNTGIKIRIIRPDGIHVNFTNLDTDTVMDIFREAAK